MTTRTELPADVGLASKVIEADTENKRLEMGKIGAFFGSPSNAVIYLAAIVIISAVIGGTILAYHEPALRPDMAKAFAALAISALGYMFGARSTG